MKILFVGDVVGALGRTILLDELPKLKQSYKPQLTIVNGENAAHGRGITRTIYKQMLQAGADVVTLGNHAWDNREIYEWIDDEPKIVRPANYPQGTPGQGYTIVRVNQYKVGIINLQGRVFMNPLDDPFVIADDVVARCSAETPIIFVDFHAEATSEKQALAWYLDGKVSAVVGTHTHVQTNDARVLHQGTAYLTDVGMTGPYDSVLGVKTDIIIQKFLTQRPIRHEISESGRGILSACVIDINEATGRAKHIETIRLIKE